MYSTIILRQIPLENETQSKKYNFVSLPRCPNICPIAITIPFLLPNIPTILNFIVIIFITCNCWRIRTNCLICKIFHSANFGNCLFLGSHLSLYPLQSHKDSETWSDPTKSKAFDMTMVAFYSFNTRQKFGCLL